MKRIWAAALGALLVLAGGNAARADYAFDYTAAGGLGGSLGSLTISENATQTEIVYTVTLTAGNIWDSGITTFFADVTGTINSVNGVTVSGTNGQGTWTSGSGNLSNKYDGLQSSSWNVWANCSLGQQETNCGTTLTVTVDGTGLNFASVSFGTTNVFAGLDVTCNNPSPSGCTSSTAITPGNTGAVGATFVAVPGPISGAGLPGLIAACVGLVVFARRRRQVLA